jgi:dihydrofolate reductase
LWGTTNIRFQSSSSPHHPPKTPPKPDDLLTFTFVTTGIESAVTQAAAAAGDKVVTVVGGPGVVNELLRTGLADELSLDLMPVFLGGGLRFFADSDLESVRVEKIDVEEIGPGPA